MSSDGSTYSSAIIAAAHALCESNNDTWHLSDVFYLGLAREAIESQQQSENEAQA